MPGARRRAVSDSKPTFTYRVPRSTASVLASHSRKVSVSLLHPSPLSWRQADLDVYVATAGSDYAGFVGAATSGFEAQGPLGENLGIHTSVDAAQAAVDGHRVRGTDSVSRRPRPLRTRRSGAHGRICGPT
ncbi:hypothetical protein QE410_001998 [Microbacterium sp. SORGH_AS 1204]|nr:hypothetical protein [Microbacterium sp. SORGH_AS_1204]